MKQLTKLTVETKEQVVYYISLTLKPEEDSFLAGFCEKAVADYHKGYVVTNVEKYDNLPLSEFRNNLFVQVKNSEYFTINPEYIVEQDKYRTHGFIPNGYDYCLAKDASEEGVYIFCEYFENNAIVRACVAQLQAWFEDETHMNDTALIRLLCSLSYHWD